MKKLLVLLLVAVAAVSVSAQNANRKGFFIEAGVGGAVGATPAMGMYLDGTNVMAQPLSGGMWSLAFGPRMRTSNHWAFDLRFQGQFSTKKMKSMATLKFMPAMRYTSAELFGNMSLYAGFGAGLAVGPDNREMPDEVLSADYVSYYLFRHSPKAGVAYNVQVGLNVTTHIYAGLTYDGQYMIDQRRFTKNGEEKGLNWGMFGISVGYRF